MTGTRMDLSKLAQPILAQDVPLDLFEADGLVQWARQLDAVPLPPPSAVPLDGSVGEVPSSEVEYRRMTEAARVAVYPDTSAVVPKTKAPVKRGPGRPPKLSSALAQAARVSLAGRAENASTSASLLAGSGLLAPIPDKLYDEDIPSPPLSSRTNSVGSRSGKAEVAVESGSQRRVEVHPPQPPSPIKTRGYTRNNRQSKRTETKASRSSRSVAKLPAPVTTVENWAQCEKCKKWRRLPPSVDTEKLPEFWVCALNVWDPAHSSCFVPEETFPDLKHQEPVAEPQAPIVTDDGVTLPIRPVEPTPTVKGFNDRLMDHEVLELLFDEQSNHPLNKRLTIHSLDANSLLATELPHNVLLVDELPTAVALSVATDQTRPPSELLHPQEELAKDDNVPRDDGSVCIGLAEKTEWPTRDNEASTIDTAGEIDPGAEPSRSLFAAMFPKLALQVPKFGKFPPIKREDLIRFEKQLEADEHRQSSSRSSGRAAASIVNGDVRTAEVSRSGRRSLSVINEAIKPPGAIYVNGKTPATKVSGATVSTGKSPRTANSGAKSTSSAASKVPKAVSAEIVGVDNKGAALSSMSREDFRGLLSLFASRKDKQQDGVEHKHCLLEDKLRASTLPLESFLQPLSLLAMPIVYSTPESSEDDTEQRSGRYNVRSAVEPEYDVATAAPQEPAPVEVKREPKRRVATRSARVAEPNNDQQLRQLREEYARSSAGKSYPRKVEPSPPEPEVPAPATKRAVRRSTSRYAREVPAPIVELQEPDPVMEELPLGLQERMLLMDLSIPIEHTAPVEQRAASGNTSHHSLSSFGVDASRTMELLTQPIDFESDVFTALSPVSTMGDFPGLQPRMCTLDAPVLPELNLQLLSEPIPDFDPESAEINVDVYKNPRLLTEV
ncbi:CW-type zinc finger containing protein [Babesia ovata]|uniref:CW-type zinc finger containing protein n=1 Tax=Babesia ovata TaxID=189622 RepID=A0A2H6K8K1_9APIC|nr:CW-type zinc finger containing protein [Babesia ovata]GBE59310.1 CW-type zinc finger containing protein [Babesia ovata]